MIELDRAEFGKQNWVWFWGWVRLGGLGLDDCWPWRPISNRGSMHVAWVSPRSNRRYSSKPSRLAWLLAGHKLPDGMHVKPKCGTKYCCNPNHLTTWTVSDQVTDAWANGVYGGRGFAERGSAQKGTANRFAKLNDDRVRQIRREGTTPEAIEALAGSFGVSPKTVRDVLKGRTWTHVPSEGVPSEGS